MRDRLSAAQQLRVIKGLESSRMSALGKRLIGELIAQLDQGPLPLADIFQLLDETSGDGSDTMVRFARAVERAHGIS